MTIEQAMDGVRNRIAELEQQVETLIKERDEARTNSEMADGCLNMIYETLKSLEPDGESLDAVPPMFYNDSIRVIVGKYKRRTDTLTARVRELERERDAWRAVSFARDALLTPTTHAIMPEGTPTGDSVIDYDSQKQKGR